MSLHRTPAPLDDRRRRAFDRCALILFAGLVCFVALLSPPTASAQTVVQHDFEDGTPQGWTPRGGGVVLTNTTEAAATGARSLKTTGHGRPEPRAEQRLVRQRHGLQPAARHHGPRG